MPDAPTGVYETCLYVDDLTAAKAFYRKVLGARLVAEQVDRHVFLRIGDSLLFLFDPTASAIPTPPDEGLPIPPHGAHGPGHVAFRIARGCADEWEQHLRAQDVAVEQKIDWPNGAQSLYFRDPAGNSLEVASENLWQSPE